MSWTLRPLKADGLLALALLVAFAPSADAVAVMSVDLGSEWMKIAVVSVSFRFLKFYEIREELLKTIILKFLFCHLSI